TQAMPRQNRSVLLGIGAIALVLILIGGSLLMLSGNRASATATPSPSNGVVLMPTVPVAIPTKTLEPTTGVALAPTASETPVPPTDTATNTPEFATRAAETLAARGTQTANAKPKVNEEQTINAMINASDTAEAASAFTATPSSTFTLTASI